MRILQFAWIIVAFLYLNSCNKDDQDQDPALDLGNIINYENLEVGQSNKYIFFIGNEYTDLQRSNFLYYTDTLMVKIISEDENGFLVKENLTEQSASRTGASNVPFPETEFYYYLTINEESPEPTLIVSSKDSRLKTRLFQFSSQTNASFLLGEYDEMEVDIVGWSTTQPLYDGTLMAYTNDFESLDITYPRLNVFIDNRDIPYGAPGTANFYHSKYGLVRAIQFNASNGKGYGWDLLP